MTGSCCDRLPSEAITLHEVMSQHQGAVQETQSLRKGLGQHFVQHVACNLLQVCAVTYSVPWHYPLQAF